ncbi:MAG: hypothetical protein HUJ93_04645 [Bacteroidales bacterium]|nr:hypothetical protein [Bacteroidales bacterium]
MNIWRMFVALASVIMPMLCNAQTMASRELNPVEDTLSRTEARKLDFNLEAGVGAAAFSFGKNSGIPKRFAIYSGLGASVSYNFNEHLSLMFSPRFVHSQFLKNAASPAFCVNSVALPLALRIKSDIHYMFDKPFYYYGAAGAYYASLLNSTAPDSHLSAFPSVAFPHKVAGVFGEGGITFVNPDDGSDRFSIGIMVSGGNWGLGGWQMGGFGGPMYNPVMGW